VEPADSILVRRSQAGDLDAFRDLVRRHAPAVRSMALSHLHDVAASEALAERVFKSAWKLLFTLRDVSWFPLFILRQAHETATVEGKDRKPAPGDAFITALGELPVGFREMLLLDAALASPGVPLLMEYTGLGKETVEGRQLRGRASLQHQARMTEAQVRQELARVVAWDGAAVAAFAEQVVTAIRQSPKFKQRPKWLMRIPPIPMPLALGMALALAAVLVGLIMRMMPPPPAATQPVATQPGK
jgi:hypothetical protein